MHFLRIAAGLIVLIVSSPTNAQDTLYWTEPRDGYFSVEQFLPSEKLWIHDEYIDSVFFSREFLAEDKHHPNGSYTGFFPDSTVAFRITFRFDGTESYLSGGKAIYYRNGQLREHGQFYSGVQFGEWNYYNEDGTLQRSTQYSAPEAREGSFVFAKDSLRVTTDTITSEADPTFSYVVSCLSNGKNGIEVLYKNAKPVEVRKYSFGTLIQTEKKKRKMRYLIRNAEILPDIILR